MLTEQMNYSFSLQIASERVLVAKRAVAFSNDWKTIFINYEISG